MDRMRSKLRHISRERYESVPATGKHQPKLGTVSRCREVENDAANGQCKTASNGARTEVSTFGVAADPSMDAAQIRNYKEAVTPRFIRGVHMRRSGDHRALSRTAACRARAIALGSPAGIDRIFHLNET